MINSIISSSLSQFPSVSWFSLYQFIKYIVIFYIAQPILKDNKLLKKTFEIIIAFVTLNAILVILQFLSQGPLGLGVEDFWHPLGQFADESKSLYRPGGFSSDPNLTASLIGITLPMTLVLGFTRNSFSKHLLALSVFVSSIAIFFTSSRTALFVSILTVIITLYYLTKTQTIHLSTKIKKRIVAGVMLMASLGAPVAIHRFTSSIQGFQSIGGLTYRTRQVKMALNFMNHYPFGVGLNAFQYAVLLNYLPQDYLYNPAPAHNLFAQLGSSLGYVGLGLFTFWIIISFKERILIYNLSSKQKQPIVLSLILGSLSYLLVSQGFPWLIRSPISEMFWIISAGIYAQKT